MTGDPFKNIVYPKQLEKIFGKFTKEQQSLIQETVKEIANVKTFQEKHDINVRSLSLFVYNLIFV